MAGYTRQSTFADGDTITAALFNNEFNQLLNAFGNTSGHKHDGTANEGPVIGLIGDAGETSPNNKVLIDTTNNYIEFYVEVSSAPVQQLYISDGAIIPVTDSDIDLGTTSLRFKDTYTDTVTTTGNVSIGGDLTVTGSATISGNLTFGDADTDSINLAAEIDSDIIPNTDGTYDLGSATKEWQDLYIDGTANIDSLVADTADINGGTIDGATIATSDITVGAGKTLDVSSGTLTLADDQISGDKVEGGTIAATTITTLTSTTGNITNVNATTLDTTNIEVTNLKAKDGTSAGSIADSTGVVTLASSVLTTTDINGGTIDGVTIGGTTAGAVTFTDLSDGTITVTAFADEDDMSSDSATLVPTQQSVKAYVDAQVTAQDLDVTTDSGTIAIDLDSETLTVTGGTGIDSSATGNAVTLAIDSTVTTLTGTQTLTNKTLTSPDVNTPDIDGGTIDSTVIGGATPAAGTFTTLTANTSITGTLATAAQPNITSVGTLTALTGGTGDLNWDSGTLFVDSSANAVGIGTTSPEKPLHINSATGNIGVRVESSDATASIEFMDSGTTSTALSARVGGISDDFFVQTNGAERMRIDSSGNVGIGETSPSTKLHITSAAPNIRLEDSDTSSYGEIVYNTAAGGLFIRSDENAATGTSGSNIFFETDSSEKMRIDSSGNVGIGTASPSEALHVYHATANINAIIESGDANAYLAFKDNSTSSSASVFLGASADDMTFFAGGTDERMRIDSSGNVGIGTDSPDEPLHIFSTTDADLLLEGTETGTTTRFAKVAFANNISGTTTDLGAITANTDGATNSSSFKFFTANAGSVSEKMIIDSSGNVGIGDTSPLAKLEIAGSKYILTDSGQARGGIHLRPDSNPALGEYGGAISFSCNGSGSSAIAAVNSNTSDTDSNGLAFIVHESSTGSADAVEAMRLDHSGNVGIGTSSPDRQLHLSAAAPAYIRLERNDTTISSTNIYGGIEFEGQDASAASAAGVRGKILGVAEGATGEMALTFETAGGYGSSTERMRIDSSGNVGIGDSSPQDYLEINGSGRGLGGLTISNDTHNHAALSFARSSTATARIFTTEPAASHTSQFNFQTSDASGGVANLVTAMVIDENQNVGIGETSPDGELHVKGTSGGNGDVYVERASGAKIHLQAQSANGKIGVDSNHNLGFNTNATTRMTISNGGRVMINTTSGSYTHAKGLRIKTDEVGSSVLDAALSIEGGAGDFYPFNFTGPSNVGFGALAAFSPSTDYFVWQYRSGGSSQNIIFFHASGSVTVDGALSKGSGSFKIDHPLESKKDTHKLVHSFIEGPQADLIYRGKVDLVDGSATVNIDTVAGMTEGTFVALNTDVQCFTTNESDWDAVKGSVSGNILTISCQNTSSTATVSWMVIGERQDQHMIDTDWTDENGKVIVEPLKGET